MTRLILAVCPSNQDRNPVVGGGSEMSHIAPLAEAVVRAAARFGIVAKLFTPQPESQDRPPGSLSGLIAQQREAARWIAAARQPGDLTVALNLHSDSGSYRHCGYYYDGRGTVSEWLGRALAESIKHWFGSRVLCADYSGYIFARETRAVACPVLLEMGAHTMRDDVAAVRDHAEEIAQQLVATMAGFFGLATTPPLNTSELRQYAVWSLARLEHGEDPRIRDAFARHLNALGCDSSDLSRWGWPS